MTDFTPEQIERATNLIAFFEQYEGVAKWDVNAFRLGFGSDTEGPGQVKVQRGMTTTRPRALANLSIRVREFLTIVEAAVGADLFYKLGPNTIAALASLAYNYGRIPLNVLDALKGNSMLVSNAIRLLERDNGGINKWRRDGEAACVALDGGQY